MARDVFHSDDVIYFELLSHDLRKSGDPEKHKMADIVGKDETPSAPMEPDSSESAPLLQEQENQNVHLGPPPPFIASK